MDNFLMDIYADPEGVEALIEQLMVRHMATLEKVCASVGDDGYGFGTPWHFPWRFLVEKCGMVLENAVHLCIM